MQRTSTPPRATGNVPPRVQAGRRFRAARVLAGDVALRELASAAGLSVGHVAAIERGEHPMTVTDLRDIGAVLGVPSAWLADGWQ